MNPHDACILAINGGSSSLKFALYRRVDLARPRVRGLVDRIGMPGTKLFGADHDASVQDDRVLGPLDHAAAAGAVLDYLDERVGIAAVEAVGHRVVNGGDRYVAPQPVTPEMLDALRRISAYTPEHLPAEIALIDLFRERLPRVAQVACFDTAFHRDMPRVAKILPIPRRYQADGVVRLGFHGLSYAYLMQELARAAGANAARGRVILAHLGNGASLAAVRGGSSVDTSMGFTPAAGVPMSTRAGDLDPGLALYFAQTEGMSPERFHAMVNHRSGLLGVSETSSDVRDLISREASDERAAEALALFCYQVKKCIGAYAAALGGVDQIVFAGGIGENAAAIRARICAGLEWLGIRIDAARNAAAAPVVSLDESPVTVRIIRTNEEVMIARSVVSVLDVATGQDAAATKR